MLQMERQYSARDLLKIKDLVVSAPSVLGASMRCARISGVLKCYDFIDDAFFAMYLMMRIANQKVWINSKRMPSTVRFAYVFR